MRDFYKEINILYLIIKEVSKFLHHKLKKVKKIRRIRNKHNQSHE